MGAGSSVRANTNYNNNVKKDTITRDNGEDCGSASKFDSFASHFASNDHSHCPGDGTSLGENPASIPAGAVPPADSTTEGLARGRPLHTKSLPPPRPRAERKKISREQRRYAVDNEEGEDGGRQGHEEKSVQISVASPDRGGRRDGIVTRPRSHRMDPSEVEEVITLTERALRGKERGQFVERGEIAGFARHHGFDITPIQRAQLFDMLDPLEQGRIANDELHRHSIPLLQKVEGVGLTRDGLRKKGSSAFQPPRRPRPACPPPDTAAPSRPSGERPPTAKRWIPSSSNGDRRASAAASLRPILSPNVAKKPANFWITARVALGDAARSNRFPDNESQKLGCHHVGENAKVVVKKDVFRRDEDQTEGKIQREEGVNRGGDVSDIVHADEGTRVEQSRSSVGAPLPAVFTREGSEEGVIHRTGQSGDEPRGSPDHLGGDNHAGYHSTSDALSACHRTPGTTAETEQGRCTRATGVATAAQSRTTPEPSLEDCLAGKDILTWTAADVRVWLQALPRGLAAFAEAKAFSDESVDGKRLATLTLTDLKKNEFHHAKFRAKVPSALWVQIKRIQPVLSSAPAVDVVQSSSRFSVGETITDEATRTPLCTVSQFVGHGGFGEVYKVLWTGVGADWGETLAMKTVRLADVPTDKRDEYRIIFVEEILTAVRVKRHPNVVNVRFAHIMAFCTDREEYLCFEDFVTGTNLDSLVSEGAGELYNGTTPEIQGRVLSYAIQLARGLGHIHRCGVLHQDIKSANVMVSDDGEVLITDFGFATVGHFGPPPPPSPRPQRPMRAGGAFPDTSSPLRGETLIPATSAAQLDTGQAKGKPIEGEEASTLPHDHDASLVGKHFRGGSGNPLGSTVLVPDVDIITEDTNNPSGGPYSSKENKSSSGDHFTLRERSGTERGEVGANQTDTAEFGLVSFGQVEDRQGAEIGVGKGRIYREPDEGGPHLRADCTSSRFDSETITVVPAADEVEQQGWDIGTDFGTDFGTVVPSHNCVLFGTLKGLTQRYQSPEASSIMERKTDSLRSQAGARGLQSGVVQNSIAPQARDDAVDAHPPYTHRSDMWAAGVVILEMYAGGLAALRGGRGEHARDLLETLVAKSRDFPRVDEVWQGEGTTSNCCADVHVKAKTGDRLPAGGVGAGGTDVSERIRNKLRVDMPEEVLELLREMFRREPRDRPVSMEVVAARLSQALGKLLEKNLVVVPLPSSDAPSPSSLCEQVPAYVETEENHGKLGRLHMWLGRALFLKGEGRRGQALQEYREGIRVLQESKADEGSASMALFRWYLGTALLDAGEIEEALPHLTEAVSIDPENAKYRHALGLAKCATGDEAGAREDLLEAALLDEEDAEDRYQLRMRRETEARKKLEKQSTRQGSEEVAGQVSPMRSERKAMDVMPAVKTSRSNAPNTSLRYSSHRQALEYACSPQPYALEKLKEYRTARGSARVDNAMGAGRGKVDAGAKALGDKTIGNGGLLSHLTVRKFSIGDQVSCGKDQSTPVKAADPLRCYPSSLKSADDSGMGGTYIIDGFLPGEKASLCFRGEAYTAMTARQPEDGIKSGRSYHVVRIGFDHDIRLATLSTSTAAAAARNRHPAAPALKADEELNAVGRDRNTGKVPDVHSGHTKSDQSNQPSEGARPVIGSTYMRGSEYMSTLRAAGRAAMVGFHTGLSGALRDFTWGSGELVLVAKSSISSDCVTLQEALCGSLYRGTVAGRHVAEEQSLGVRGAAERMLTIAKQTAEAISHCHCRGILLQDITPNDVLVTPRWSTLLRPNYVHAREGRPWTTAVSIRDPPPHAARSTAALQHVSPSRRMSLSSDEEPLVAPFSDATRQDYQSPEIAQIRKERRSHVRVSSRTLRRSKLSPLPEERREQSPAPPALRSTNRDSTDSTEAKHAHDLGFVGDGGDESSTDVVVGPCGNNGGGGDESNATTPVAEAQGGTARTANQREGRDRDRDLSPLVDSTLGSGGQDVSLIGAPYGSEVPTVTPCTSDIWAWALIVLQMFSDEAWPPDSGQDGLLALEALLQRRKDVDTWTIEDVVSWLGDVGLWSENTEREIRAFKIDGRQLLIPTCRRDVMEKLGLFITDGELSHRLWDSIAGGLQRWTMPSQLPHILRRCLADRPDDRFSTMEEVCTLLRGITTGSGSGTCSTVPTATSPTCGDDRSLDGLRTGMLLNNTALCLANEGDMEEAQKHYKMALLASEELPEAHYNLGLLYSSSAINKFREAQHLFETAASLMGADDPRRRISSEHARAAERKSNFYQSEEVMNALSGKYNNSVCPKDPREITISRTSREQRGSEDGDGKRRPSTPPSETFLSPPWNSSITKASGLSPKGPCLATLSHRSPGLSPRGPGLATLSNRARTTRKPALSPL